MAKVETRPKRIPISREEFEKLPEGPPYYDYIGGEAIELNRPTGKHQDIVGVVWSALRQYLRSNNLGKAWFDINVALPTGITIGPDISVLLKEHLDRYDEQKGDIIDVPELIVEVLSSTASYDRVDKFAEYFRAGVPWVWFIDQDALTVEEFQWTSDGYLLTQIVKSWEVFHPRKLPNLELNLKELVGE